MSELIRDAQRAGMHQDVLFWIIIIIITQTVVGLARNRSSIQYYNLVYPHVIIYKE